MSQPAITPNIAIIENLWIQFSALGVLFAVLLSGIILLYRKNQEKDKIHKGEWEKLRVEQRTDREISDKRHDERTAFFVKAMTDSSDKFASIIEGSLKDTNQFLAKNEVVLNNCSRKG